jgi:hypothetical protein
MNILKFIQQTSLIALSGDVNRKRAIADMIKIGWLYSLVNLICKL